MTERELSVAVRAATDYAMHLAKDDGVDRGEAVRVAARAVVNAARSGSLVQDGPQGRDPDIPSAVLIGLGTLGTSAGYRSGIFVMGLGWMAHLLRG